MPGVSRFFLFISFSIPYQKMDCSFLLTQSILHYRIIRQIRLPKPKNLKYRYEVNFKNAAQTIQKYCRLELDYEKILEQITHYVHPLRGNRLFQRNCRYIYPVSFNYRVKLMPLPISATLLVLYSVIMAWAILLPGVSRFFLFIFFSLPYQKMDCAFLLTQSILHYQAKVQVALIFSCLNLKKLAKKKLRIFIFFFCLRVYWRNLKQKARLRLFRNGLCLQVDRWKISSVFL